MVDTESLSFKIAREYMIRLDKSDFEDMDKLRKIAQVTSMTAEQFKAEFSHVVEGDLAVK